MRIFFSTLSRIFHPHHIVVASNVSHKVREFVASLPATFEKGTDTIYKGRNELKRFEIEGEKYIVKAYRLPHFINRIAYRTVRASKAERSYRYAVMLKDLGIGTPEPIGFVTTGWRGILGKSYSVTKESVCPYTYRDFAKQDFANRDDILRAIAHTTARLHEAGWLHKDYSAGNILFRTLPDGKVEIEIIDLNRMRFGKVDMQSGCRNFERLPGTSEMLRTIAQTYAEERGFDANTCYKLIFEACKAEGKLTD